MAKTITPDQLLGIDSVFDKDDLEWAGIVRSWLDDNVRENIGDYYLDGTIPARELAEGLGDLGVLGMHLEGYGCGGSTATQYGLACRELEAVDSGLRSLVSVQGSLAMFAIHHWGSEDQKNEWLPKMAAGKAIGCFGLTEPDVGSDPAGMKTHAKKDGDDWILNGAKMWITNSPVADVAVVWAKTEELDKKGRPMVRGFVVPTDTPGFSAPKIQRKLSLRASITGEIVLDNVRLPADAMLPKAEGLKGPLSCLSEARFGIVFGVTGAARDALEAALDYTGTRIQFDRPLSSFQISQQKLAKAFGQYSQITLLAAHLGRIKDSAAGVTPEQISLGKMVNADTAMNICRDLRALFGGSGITSEYPVLRHAINLETVLTYEGTHEVHQLTIGRALTGINAFANYQG
ncbi:acyl-CoA dehydrogenase family protein [Brevibacterium sp. 50QC2O2]|uniref:acyl-CoA dehydrogenase family protein n=1 Tax=unclassified Brevibacterium TaxID=2614124 RepID=UPI00211BBDA8|nr:MULTISPECIES: acyl-CoA dehydrogenase family protein [unclassified Brevibacterium]MCQ9367754.1 acyl-CoA dehydrogenase family protein [Brevibacterium sp. 91QC2O2]MCQ9388013.1 acyl-CoA dehydrogenase family protein [Brevibacterium sp. 50QC2O2]